MAVTSDQVEPWERKLEALMPGWMKEDISNPSELGQGKRREIVIKAMATMVAEFETDLRDHIKQTFIGQAVDNFLDLHANERGKTRLPQETIDSYRARIRAVVSNSNCPAIQGLVDPILIVGSSTINENNNEHNSFTVSIPRQIPDPNSYFNTEFFLNGESFLGTLGSDPTIIEDVRSIVEESKAFGIKWNLNQT